MSQVDDERTRLEISIAAEDNALKSGVMSWGDLTPFTCPESHAIYKRLSRWNSAKGAHSQQRPAQSFVVTIRSRREERRRHMRYFSSSLAGLLVMAAAAPLYLVGPERAVPSFEEPIPVHR